MVKSFSQEGTPRIQEHHSIVSSPEPIVKDLSTTSIDSASECDSEDDAWYLL